MTPAEYKTTRQRLAAERTNLEAELARARARLEDLAMMLRRFIWRIEKRAGDDSLKALATTAGELLRRYELMGSLLREEEMAPTPNTI